MSLLHLISEHDAESPDISSELVPSTIGDGVGQMRTTFQGQASALAVPTADLSTDSPETATLNLRQLDVIRVAVFTPGALSIIQALLRSSVPIARQELIKAGGTPYDFARLSQAANTIVQSERIDPDSASIELQYSLTPAWRTFFTTVAVSSDRDPPLHNFARLRPYFLRITGSEYLPAWLPHLLQKPQTFTSLQDICSAPPASTAKARKRWFLAKCEDYGSMLAVDASGSHAEDPLVSLDPDFKEWFLKMMNALSETLDKTTFQQPNIPEHDFLSQLECYEYLSDLDAGFEEELRSLGVDPAWPTAAKPGSEEKVQMLAARYAAGLPLWHADDKSDNESGHGALFGDNDVEVDEETEEPELE